ncbi:spore coat associated protein CotJA [Halobacillus litoralis]|uniref:spore coat associated protein CotJA n=1 Tax=Halobacillus litoralis TaxID=45668 RepID=UPI001CD229D2|nr:spore coat associated protein CotJA [Halobacillus litoralis]MCA0970316.1 spore coat associated protein CotJA [Halobacillus litoralis]
MYTPVKCYQPYYSPFDPCPPRTPICYATPPNLYLGFQQPNLPQYSLKEALYKGTLWPSLYDPYPLEGGGYREQSTEG